MYRYDIHMTKFIYCGYCQKVKRYEYEHYICVILLLYYKSHMIMVYCNKNIVVLMIMVYCNRNIVVLILQPNLTNVHTVITVKG